MALPLDDQQVQNLNRTIHQQILSQFQGEWASRLNVDQMFVLIDGILPFEACLYYQVLPLFLEGNRLHLGMVSPDDTAASEYVRRIISYLNYSLVSHSISSEALRVVLTAYLNYVGNQPTNSTRRESFSYGHYRHSSRVKADQPLDPNERLTLVVDSPDDLYVAEGNNDQPVSSSITPSAREALSTAPPTAFEDEPQNSAEFSAAEDQSQPEFEVLPSQEQSRVPDLNNSEFSNPLNLTESVSATPSSDIPVETPAVQSPSGSGNSSNKSLAILHVEANHLTSPVEVLATLPPQQLMQELLARVLLGGIGRLYFERYPENGRVVWSQNGVLQSVLDNVSLSVFQGIIDELKDMACVSHLPIAQPQQTEMEYLYARSCVLLRFRFMPGRHGEEATVQVLRGAALKFYQQQQLNKLERDAMSIAKQLQAKLNEIRVRAYSNPNLSETRFETLPKLAELLHHIEEQLDALGVNPTE